MTIPGAVAVIIVNYNGGAYLPRCLTALERQSRQPDHVIIVDNASEVGGTIVMRNISNPRHYADLLLRELRRWQ